MGLIWASLVSVLNGESTVHITLRWLMFGYLLEFVVGYATGYMVHAMREVPK